MRQWQDLLLQGNSSIREALALFEKNREQVAIIISPEHQLLGTVTDGDIRRGLLKNIDLTSPVTKIMNSKPVSVTSEQKETDAALLSLQVLRYLPIVDQANQVIGVRSYKDFSSVDAIDNPVVIMAGGEGQRLRPLTETTPKPLLDVDGKPILERLLLRLRGQGFRKFYFSINYLGEMIERHFGNGSQWGVEINYLREDQKLGTGGALSLLRSQNQDRDVVLLNGDLVTDVNFHHLLQYHESEKADITVCIQKINMMVPYGVVHYKQLAVTAIEEKPTLAYHINCGIYVLSPDILRYVPENQYFDMPSLVTLLVKEKKSVLAFPVYEDWNDIANVQDLQRVRQALKTP